MALLIAMASLFLFLTCERAWHKPFWYDEILTLTVADQHSLHDIWKAETVGFELNPPISYILTKLTRHLGAREEFWARLPQIVSYFVLLLCLSVFIARRLPLSFAIPAASFALLSQVYEYSYEARGYGIELGCAAAALVAWQAATDRTSKWKRLVGLVGLALALSTALLSHVFAVLVYIPICAGELWRTWPRKRVDVSICIMLIVGLTPLVLYPALLVASHNLALGTSIFAPTARRFFGAYALLLKQALPPLAAIFIPIMLFAYRNRTAVRTAAADLLSRVPAHELVATLIFTLVPACGFALARFLRTSYVSRYGLSGAVGFALLFGFLGYVLCAARPVWTRWVAAVTLAWFIASFTLTARTWRNQAPSGNNNEPFVIAAAATGRPVVIADGRSFLEFSYYLPRVIGKQIVYLDDPKLAMRLTGSDAVDTPMLLMRPWLSFPVRIENYGDFTTRNTRFWLFSAEHPLVWVPRQLQLDGAAIRPAIGPNLYDVTIDHKQD